MILCPHCGLPNIPERSICKRCRQPLLDTGPAQQAASTGDTSAIFHDHVGSRMLIFSPTALEYDAPGVRFAAPYWNIKSIDRTLMSYMMNMYFNPNNTDFRQWEQRLRPPISASEPIRYSIPIAGFGYPQNIQLHAELRRRMPWLHLHPLH